MKQLTIAIALLSGLNLLLLGVLASVWIANYRTFRTRELLALACFAVVLAAENLAAVAFYFSMSMLYSGNGTAMGVAATLRGLQFVALCFLTWATVR